MKDRDRDRIAGYKLIGKLPVPEFDVLAWALWFEANREACIVGKTEVGPLTVSTVFLGLDHGWGQRSRFFETMVFGARDHLIELVPGSGRKRLIRHDFKDYQERYETWAEAEAGHARAVEWAKAELAKLDAAISPALSSPSRTEDDQG